MTEYDFVFWPSACQSVKNLSAKTGSVEGGIIKKRHRDTQRKTEIHGEILKVLITASETPTYQFGTGNYRLRTPAYRFGTGKYSDSILSEGTTLRQTFYT